MSIEICLPSSTHWSNFSKHYFCSQTRRFPRSASWYFISNSNTDHLIFYLHALFVVTLAILLLIPSLFRKSVFVIPSRQLKLQWSLIMLLCNLFSTLINHVASIHTIFAQTTWTLLLTLELNPHSHTEKALPVLIYFRSDSNHNSPIKPAFKLNTAHKHLLIRTHAIAFLYPTILPAIPGVHWIYIFSLQNLVLCQASPPTNMQTYLS